MFDRDRFTQDCLDAIRKADSHVTVKEVVQRAPAKAGRASR